MDAQAGDSPWTYCIAVQGQLDESWSDWFSGLSVTVKGAESGAPVTVLSGPVADQAALRGILNKLWDLNLTLIAVSRAAEDPSGGR